MHKKGKPKTLLRKKSDYQAHFFNWIYREQFNNWTRESIELPLLQTKSAESTWARLVN